MELADWSKHGTVQYTATPAAGEVGVAGLKDIILALPKIQTCTDCFRAAVVFKSKGVQFPASPCAGS